MREFIDRGVLANLVSMLRTEIKGAIWLADADDESRFYEQCAHSHARVLPSRGASLELLSDTRIRGIQGVVASPRRPLLPSPDVDVFVPDVGDVASLLLMSTGLDDVLHEIAGAEWCRASEREIGSIIDRALAVAWRWERVLECASRRGDALVGKIGDWVDWTEFSLSFKFAEHICAGHAAEMWRSLDEREQSLNRYNKLSGTDGRNVVQVIADATRSFRPLGIAAMKCIDAEILVSMLNVAFKFDTLESDAIFWKMRRWERNNLRFPLLKNWRTMDAFGLVWEQRYWKTDLRALLSLMVPGDSFVAFKMDLDNFSGVNKKLEHSGGDEAIREYLRCVRECLAGFAEIYRRGGDEVVAFAPAMRWSDALNVAERLRATIEARFVAWSASRGLEVAPTVSIGMVQVALGMDVDAVEALMEKAQWRAKNEGKNRVVAIQEVDVA